MDLQESITRLEQLRKNENSKEEDLLANEILEKLSLEELTYINNKIKEMREGNLYRRLSKCHGKRHIEHVMLFAMIIATFEQIDPKDRNLLIEATMYHDEGRENDRDEQHGINSANIAGKSLKGEYQEEDLKMIQAAIIFHDDRTEGNSIQEKEDTGFQEICNKFNLTGLIKERTRKIADILKDADALDRTRFVGKSYSLDPKFLRTKTAKRLTTFATRLNEIEQSNEEKRNFFIKQEELSLQLKKTKEKITKI